MTVMNLLRKSPRGSSLVNSDLVNCILYGQWNDNKVVSFISNLGVSGKVTVSRSIGSKKIDFEIEEALKRYACNNFMGGMDNVDKDKKLLALSPRSILQQVVPYGASGHF